VSDVEVNSRQILVARFKLLTEEELPRHAREAHWPLRLDHCFKRVCLDWASGDCWYRHIARPAERNADVPTLQRAVACAEEILAAGSILLRERDATSLRWRCKGESLAARASDDSEKSRSSGERNP